MRTSTPLALAFTASFLWPGGARAHDLWLERAGGDLVLRYGHRGGELLAIDRSKVKAVRCLEQGKARDLLPAATFSPTEVRATAGCEAASASLDGGFNSLTPDGEVNLPRNRAGSVVKAWASRQYAKWVSPGTAAATALLGDELELVPVTDLARAHQGDKVTLRVLYQGEPAPGAVVAIDHRPLGETDSAGEARVKLRTSAVETLSVTLRREVRTAEADYEVLEASLSFQVAR